MAKKYVTDDAHNRYPAYCCEDIDKMLEEGGSVPVFDLIELGLPEIPDDGTAVSLSTDTTDICAALDAGAVEFIVNLADVGRVELVMNKYRVDTYGLYMCSMSFVGGMFTIMIADGHIQASADSQGALPDVTESDDGKVLGVVGGVWSVVTPTAGGATIPVYNFTDMGLPTVTIDGEGVMLETDTAELFDALENGVVTIKFKFLLDGLELDVTKTLGGIVNREHGIASITSQDYFGEIVVATTIMIQNDYIYVAAVLLDSMINGMIDAYMEDALGGDY